MLYEANDKLAPQRPEAGTVLPASGPVALQLCQFMVQFYIYGEMVYVKEIHAVSCGVKVAIVG